MYDSPTNSTNDFLGCLQSPASKDFYEWWYDAKGDRAFVRRNEIDPRHFCQHMPSMIVVGAPVAVEAEYSSLFTWRYVGSSIENRFNSNGLSGSFFQFWHHGSRQSIKSALEAATSMKIPVVFHFHATEKQNHKLIQRKFELVCCPMLSQSQKYLHFIGVIYPQNNHSNACMTKLEQCQLEQSFYLSNEEEMLSFGRKHTTSRLHLTLVRSE